MPYVIPALFSLSYMALVYLSHTRKNPMKTDAFLRPYAHRGLHGKGAAENSLPAFKEAVRHGYGVELDVRITRDHHLAVFHDQSLKRMCSVDRDIESMTLQELGTLRLGDTDQHIPLLGDVLTLVRGKTPLMIELKTPANADVRRRYVRLICESLSRYSGKVCVVSFDPRLLHLMKKHLPHIPRGQLVTSGKGTFAALLLAPLLHLYAHPHFLSCQMGSGCHSYKIARLFHSVLCGWTIRSMAKWQAVEHIFDLMVFEAFLPQADATARLNQKEGNLS